TPLTRSGCTSGMLGTYGRVMAVVLPLLALLLVEAVVLAPTTASRLLCTGAALSATAGNIVQ
ncbi:MAG TPA: hypothetical protein VGW38_24655, partial [Chloroflexota bacterium]|nr:hypothetical protein [Chloroflexota bacterium]